MRAADMGLARVQRKEIEEAFDILDTDRSGARLCPRRACAVRDARDGRRSVQCQPVWALGTPCG